MAKIIWSDSLKDDIRTLSERVFQHALEKNEAPLEAQEKFEKKLKKELIKIGSLIVDNPFACQAYSKSNPTRRGVLSNGNFILEYQIIPSESQTSTDVTQIILTALVAARSERYRGAYDDIEVVSFDDLILDD